MFEASSFPFKKLGICLCAVAGMCLWTGDVFAQGEQEKVEIENTRNMERPNLEDHTSSPEAGNARISVLRQSSPVVKVTAAKKENMAAGEGKKGEQSQAPSTLSFNMFLYIVDKFKAD